MADNEKQSRLTDYFGSLPTRLMCSTRYGYCARCLLHDCPDRAEPLGEPRQRPPLPDGYWDDALLTDGDGSN